MSYTIGYRMPMRDRPRVRTRLVMVFNAGRIEPTEATDRAMARLAELPDGTMVEALQVLKVDDPGRGGDEKAKPQPKPSETPTVSVIWNRRICSAFSADDGAGVSPSGLAYPSEDGGMSFELPSNDAMSVLVTTDEEPPLLSSLPSWAEDEAIASLPDGSVVECLWTDGGEVVGRRAYLMHGRALAMFYASDGSGGEEVAQ